jgi:hypothetical protein
MEYRQFHTLQQSEEALDEIFLKYTLGEMI